MDPLGEMLAVDERQALRFFFQRLKDVCGSGVDSQELLYNASVLAHYAQVSTLSEGELSARPDLAAFFDQFILDTTVLDDGVVMETAGAQCLLLAGFFEDQMRRRHNIRWYSQLGSSFFSRAAAQESSRQKALLLETLARRFEAWRQRHARLARDLRDQPFLMSRPGPPATEGP